MTTPGREHTRFDELAAGYTLHCLTPGDEREFLRHARECGRCADTLAGYADVAAALADLAPAADPAPDLGARIIAAATGSPAAAVPADAPATARGRVLPFRLRGGLARAAVAAVAVLVAGAGAWAGLAVTGHPAAPALADCAREHTCSQVVLASASGHEQVAKVIVRAGTVWLIPAGLPPDHTATHIYVLWQITGAHTPLPIGSFDIQRGHRAPIRVGGLAASYRGTWAFAVTLEPGRVIPARPSQPVALGQVAT